MLSKLIVLAIGVTFTLSVNAEEKKISRKPAKTYSGCADLKRIGDKVDAGNGTVKFNESSGPITADKAFYAKADKKVMARLQKRFDGTECGAPKRVVGRKIAIGNIGDERTGSNPEAAKDLKALNDKGGIVAIVGAEWDGQHGDESCPIYYYDIYSPDGCLLSLNIDSGD